jgi:hypothetical protein
VFISRDPLGFVDGMSVYQGWAFFGVSQDPYGLWDVQRKNKPRAHAIPDEEGESIQALAEEIGLDPAEAHLWLNDGFFSTQRGIVRRANILASDIISCGEVTVPNKAFLTASDIYNYTTGGERWGLLIDELLEEADDYAEDKLDDGFYVEFKFRIPYNWDTPFAPAAPASRNFLSKAGHIGALLDDPDAHEWIHFGHGDPNGIITVEESDWPPANGHHAIEINKENRRIVNGSQFTHNHKLAEIHLYSCFQGLASAGWKPHAMKLHASETIVNYTNLDWHDNY